MKNPKDIKDKKWQEPSQAQKQPLKKDKDSLKQGSFKGKEKRGEK